MLLSLYVYLCTVTTEKILVKINLSKYRPPAARGVRLRPSLRSRLTLKADPVLSASSRLSITPSWSSSVTTTAFYKSGFIQKTRHKNQGHFKDFQALNYIFPGPYIFIDTCSDFNTTRHNLVGCV